MEVVKGGSRTRSRPSLLLPPDPPYIAVADHPLIPSHGPDFLAIPSCGLAGTSVDLLFFPIDTVKTRLQSTQGFGKAGGFRGIYRGVGSVIVGSAPGAAVFFVTYDTLKQVLPTPPHLAPVNHVLSASVGEIAACLIRVPTEVIKTRTQTSTYGPLVTSSWASAKKIMSTDGLAGFYRGFFTTVMREIPFTSIQFPLYEFLKYRLSRALRGRQLCSYEAAACGSVAGAVAASVTTPLDVLKTRVMLDLRNPSIEKLPSLLTRFKQIYTNEGIKALFAGIVPRTLWISAGGAVFLGVYEQAVRTLPRM